MSPHAFQAVGETLRTYFSHWRNRQEYPRLGVSDQGQEFNIRQTWRDPAWGRLSSLPRVLLSPTEGSSINTQQPMESRSEWEIKGCLYGSALETCTSLCPYSVDWDSVTWVHHARWAGECSPRAQQLFS